MNFFWWKRKETEKDRFERKAKQRDKRAEELQEKVNLLEQTMRDLKPYGK